MDYVYIPDPNLKATINYQLNPIRPPEQEITEDEMLSLDDLIGDNRGIMDLTGLEKAKNLRGLVLTSNSISDLIPLSSLDNLVVLDLTNNQITDISPIRSIATIRFLYLMNNEITNIEPLSTLVNLEYLYLLNNKITDIEAVRSLVNLEFLLLADNEIVDISPVASLTNIVFLYVYNNKVTNISAVSTLVTLKYLYLGNNEISDISPVKTLYNLRTLSGYDNKISDLSPIKSLVNLQRLVLYSNKISDISPLSGLINLITLDIFNNQIFELKPLNSLGTINNFNAKNQTIITKGSWSNGMLTIETTMLKNIDGSIPDRINNINPESGTYDSIRKTVTWNPISYNTEASFDFLGENTFSGTVIREGNTGPKALQLQLDRCKTMVNYQQPIIFNKTIYSNGIKYDYTNGTITFISSGLYSINWWVAGMESGYTGVFAVKVVGGEQIIGNANNHPGQVSGSAIIEVITAPMEIQLINLNTRCGQHARVMLSDEVPVQANITIVDYFNYNS